MILGLFGRNKTGKERREKVRDIRRLVRDKKYDAALKASLEYLRMVPENHDILFIAGSVYYMRGRYKSALPYFDRALEIGRYDTEALLLKARCHSMLGERDAAKRCCRDILEVDPKNREALCMLDGA